MGRFIITRDSARQAYAERMFSEGGLVRNRRLSRGGVHITTFRKVLEESNQNTVSFSNGDFISVVGTFIYSGKTGLPAIRELYADFKGDVNRTKERIVGNFACILKKGDVLFVFSDALGLQRIYYANVPGELLVSEDLSKIAMLLERVSVNEFALLEQAFQYSNLDEDTIFREISSLQGDQYLEIRGGKLQVRRDRRFRHDERLPVRSCQEMAEELSMMMKRSASLIADVFPDVRINITGGVDSRMMLAAFIAIGKSPTIMHGVGDTKLTNTFDEDLSLAKRIAEDFRLPLKVMDWRLGPVTRRQRKMLIDRYGQLFMLNFARLMQGYEGSYNKGTIILDGLVGEQFRNMEWVDRLEGEHLDFDTFMDNYFYYDPRYYVVRSGAYIDYVRKKYLRILHENGIDPNAIRKDDFQRLNNYYRIQSTPTPVNLMNVHLNSINFLFTPDVFNYLRQVPAEYKKEAGFQLRVLHDLCPGLLDIPFFTHCRKAEFDERAFVLRTKPSFLQFAKRNLPKRLIEGYLRRLYSLATMGRKSRRIYRDLARQIASMQKKLGLSLVKPNRGVYMPVLHSYLEHLRLIDYVNANRFKGRRR